MSTNYPVTPATLAYCSADDVAAEINKPTGYFTVSTVPTLAQVQNHILQAQEKIDNQTGRAWRLRKVTNEYLSAVSSQRYSWGTGMAFPLSKRFVAALASGSGDKVEVWDGSNWIDWMTAYQEGRNKDFWMDYEDGVLYIKRIVLPYEEKVVRITYRYGETTVPADIQECCAKLVAVKVMTNEDRTFLLNDGGDARQMSYDTRVSKYNSVINGILATYAELPVVSR